MNYRIDYTPMHCRITKTGEAIDNHTVFGTLKIARAHLADHVDKMIENLREAKKVALKESDSELSTDPVATSKAA